MKKLLAATVAVVVTLVFMLATPANAWLNLSGAANDLPTQETTHYRLEAAGTDFDAYEWVSPADSSVICVALSSRNTGPVGHDCVGTLEPITLAPDQPTVESVGFTIDTRWRNTRVYEWRLVNNPAVVCSTMRNSSGKFGLQCENTEN